MEAGLIVAVALTKAHLLGNGFIVTNDTGKGSLTEVNFMICKTASGKEEGM